MAVVSPKRSNVAHSPTNQRLHVNNSASSKINHLLSVSIFHIIKDKNTSKYILLDVLICSIAVYFYELFCILTSP